MPIFRKRPVEVEAVQFTGENYSEIFEFAGHIQISKNGCKIVTLEGIMEALPGDWIIKGVKGEFYPCKPDIFQETYKEIKLDERE